MNDGRARSSPGKRPIRVVLVAGHPVQYTDPLYRLYAHEDRLAPLVVYLDVSTADHHYEEDFGTEVRWDVPMLEGYEWVAARGRTPRRRLGLTTLWRVIREEDPDVVVSYGHRRLGFWVAALAAKTTGSEFVFTTDAHTLDDLGGSGGWRANAKRVALPAVFGIADGVLAPSTATIRYLHRLGVPEAKTFLTPYVVDNDFFSERAAQTDVEEQRQRWDVEGGSTVALFVGKLVPWKRPEDLLIAGAQVPGLHMVFAGDGPLRSQLESRARELGCTQRSTFLGFVNQSELPSVNAAADVLVLPSDYESFGLVVNEAFACGTPAVVSDACGSAGDLVVDGETGYVYPAGDIFALAEHLASIQESGSISKMGMEARRRIANWGPEQNVGALVRALDELTSRG